ncbi:DNA-binding transcriptional regulator, ArsR family [Arthrobacter alpinus]|uniref:DNA-binding transcriptional regulator, ArsR family n=1 Tax=Arthrobacter alpinus TaxID=656366 RepID=A0A1H5PEP7_9MICC|nr:helix-turn-helix transcriptional regulator [Arthrobacter alpinus]SEF11497.1 DNA-binding transcriptional regulator, ArsR family [Arthrobacter alpinus]
MPEETIFPPQIQLFLKALSSESRQKTLALFATGRALSVGEASQLSGLGQSTTSEQLAALRAGGLLRADRYGKTVMYRPDPDAIREQLKVLSSYLNTCCPPLGESDGSR